MAGQHVVLACSTKKTTCSDAEKEAIREVLRQMDDYVVNEVLSMPEYAAVRHDW